MANPRTQKHSDNHSPDYEAEKLRVLRRLQGKNVGKEVVHKMITDTIWTGHVNAAILNSPIVRFQNEAQAFSLAIVDQSTRGIP